jgi:anti-sigma regulatory factor (Ser/Thr protein kinase)
VFGTLPAADNYFHRMLKQLEPKAKTVGLISANDSFDWTLSNGTAALLKHAGLAPVLDLQFSKRFPNFFNILRTIKAKAPDVILWSGHEAGAIKFIRESKSDNVNPKLLGSFTCADRQFSLRARQRCQLRLRMTPSLLTKRLTDRWFGDASQFAGAFEKRFSYAPDYHGAAAVEAYVVALEAAGTLDRKAVSDAIANLGFESVYGRSVSVRMGKSCCRKPSSKFKMARYSITSRTSSSPSGRRRGYICLDPGAPRVLEGMGMATGIPSQAGSSAASELRIANTMSEIARVATLVDRFGAYHKFSNEVIVALNVSLDEILNNIISYAFDDPGQHEIVVRLKLGCGKVEVVVQDDGKPFNPLEVPTPNLEAKPRAAGGGVGLHFVRNLTDQLEYARRDGINQLRLTKNLEA